MEKRGIFLTNRHVSWVLSFFIITSFFIFIAGYFLGKKKAVEKFYNKIDQDSLADHIYYSVCSIYDNNNEEAMRQESTEESSEALNEKGSKEADVSLVKNNKVSNNKLSDTQVSQNSEKADKTTKLADMSKAQKGNPEKTIEKITVHQENFYAELIGFGTAKAANRFVDKLKKQGFSVVLRRRRSKSSKGKTIIWYQVITEKFDNKSDLIAFVDIIKDKERLKGVRIIQC